MLIRIINDWIDMWIRHSELQLPEGPKLVNLGIIDIHLGTGTAAVYWYKKGVGGKTG